MVKKDEWVEAVYDTLCGVLIVPVEGVENAFAEGSVCAKEYEEVMNAYGRLCKRLGVKNEDDDVEIIINSLRSITNELCFRMYTYGVRFGKDT